MRAVVQRVSSASVSIATPGEGENQGRVTTGSIGGGLLVFLGVAKGDAEADADYLAEKIAALRIFTDSEERMNLSLLDLGLPALVVSQFTLLADVRKGRRPSWSDAAENDEALRLYGHFCEALGRAGVRVETGKFREVMRIECTHEGPVTILLDSRKIF